MSETIAVKIIESMPSPNGQPHKWKAINNAIHITLASWDPRPELEIGGTYEVSVNYNDTYDQYQIVAKSKINNLGKVPKVPKPSVKERVEKLEESEKEQESLEKYGEEPDEETEQTGLVATSQVVLDVEVLKKSMKEQWELFNHIKNTYITKADWQIFGTPKPFLKKSGYIALYQGFKLSTEEFKPELEIFDPPLIVEKTNKDKETGETYITEHIVRWQYYARVRVFRPDGTFTDGTGFCGSWDKGMTWQPHDAAGKAVTRAFCRAVDKIVGIRLSSAEDMR